jgi:hypothetical protein
MAAEDDEDQPDVEIELVSFGPHYRRTIHHWSPIRGADLYCWKKIVSMIVHHKDPPWWWEVP